MSQLNVDTIKKADGTGNLSVPAETGTVVTTASPSLGRRNLIINGGQVIDQRNGGSAITSTGYCTDRFQLNFTNDGAQSLQQVTDAPAGFQYSLKYTQTTADSDLGSGQYSDIRYNVEGYDMAYLDWGTSDAKTVTLSFWAKSSLTGTHGGAFSNNDFNRSYPFSYTINTADTWEYKTITVSGDTTGTWLKNSSRGAYIFWTMGAGTSYVDTAGAWVGQGRLAATGQVAHTSTLNSTFQITGVQLEVGSVATPFEHRSYGEELALCQRYYQVYGGTEALDIYVDAYGDYALLQMNNVVTMRDDPTGTIFGTFVLSNMTGQPVFQGVSARTHTVGKSTSSQGRAFWYSNSNGGWTLEAEL